MGFFDDEVRGSFDEMFDLNHDGMIDPGERAMQFEFLEDQMNDYDDQDEFEDDYEEDEDF